MGSRVGIRMFQIILLIAISSVLSTSSSKYNNNYIVTMKARTGPILSSINNIPKNTINRQIKLEKLVTSLKTHAHSSQKEILKALNQEVVLQNGQFTFESLWISNQIILRGATNEFVKRLSLLEDVASISKDFAFHLSPSSQIVGVKTKSVKADTTPWGIEKIQATSVWAQGFNGTGIIVSTIDSGAQLNHEALQSSYVGKDNFGWYDPIENTEEPMDDLGHGTHTMGTIVGHASLSDGDMRIGVAPGSRWMACKGCTGDNYCWASDVNSCFQFLLCPRAHNGTECDSSKAPHVINNSYFIDYLGTRDDIVEASLDALSAAGIVSVFAIGNFGACAASGYPGDYINVIAVGATSSDDDLASFSSSGPGSTHGLDVIKPEIIAPGLSVLSSVVGSGHEYDEYSGTSMASPHVAGVVALMFSKNLDLEVTQIREILFNTTETTQMSENRNCGGIDDSVFPNFSLGYGRVNALNAVNAVPDS